MRGYGLPPTSRTPGIGDALLTSGLRSMIMGSRLLRYNGSRTAAARLLAMYSG